MDKPTDSDVVAPPIGGDGSGFEPGVDEPAGQPWAWAVFGALILLLFGLMMANYFGFGAPAKKKPSVASMGADSKLTMKGLAVQYAAQRLQGTPQTPAGENAIKKSLEPVEKAAAKIAGESMEGARYLVVVQKLRGEQVETEALNKLLKSSDQTDRAVAMAVNGDAKAVEELDKSSEDWSERFAYALAAQAGGEKDALGKVADQGTVWLFLLTVLGGISVVGGGVITIIGYVVLQAQNPKPAVGYPMQKLDNFGADLSALKATIYLFFYFAIGQTVVGGGLILAGVEMGVAVMLSMLFGLGFLLLMLKLPMMNTAADWSTLMGVKGKVWQHIGAGFLAYLANFPIFLTLTVIAAQVFKGLPAPSHGITEQLSGDVSWVTILALGISAAILAPITEEIVFRGWVFRGLLQRTGKVWLSILICGVSFAIIHPQGPIIYPALAAIGAMGAFVTYRTGSLLPAMVMHGLHNATILFVGQVLLK